MIEVLKKEISVLEYVDYSSKYGVGYLLNDNCFGVFFNDSTKIIYDPSKDIISKCRASNRIRILQQKNSRWGGKDWSLLFQRLPKVSAAWQEDQADEVFQRVSGQAWIKEPHFPHRYGYMPSIREEVDENKARHHLQTEQQDRPSHFLRQHPNNFEFWAKDCHLYQQEVRATLLLSEHRSQVSEQRDD